MLKDVKFAENIYPLNLISMLKAEISMSMFTPQFKFHCLFFFFFFFFFKSMLKYPLLPFYQELCSTYLNYTKA